MFVLDGNNIFCRYYFINSERAEEFFVSNLLKRLEDEKVFICFDKCKNQYRKSIFQEYKSNRTHNIDLINKIQNLKSTLRELNYNVLEAEELEADDIIYNICKINSMLKKPHEVVVISKDADLYSVIDDNTVIWRDLIGKDIINKEIFENKYNISTDKWIFVKALMGDNSDNIKGVNKVGIKTALKIIKEHSDNLDNFIKEKYSQEDVNNYNIALKLVTPIENFELIKQLLKERK